MSGYVQSLGGPRWPLPAVMVVHGAALGAMLLMAPKAVPPVVDSLTWVDLPQVSIRAADKPAPPQRTQPPMPVRKTDATPRPAPAKPAPASPQRPLLEPLAQAPDAALAPGTPPAAPPVPAAKPGPAAEAPLQAPRFDADYLNNPRPPYPPLARRMGEEGVVRLRVRVGVDGKPLSVQVARSSGSRVLDDAAERAVSGWRFVPARRGDEAVAADVIVPISFKLEGNP